MSKMMPQLSWRALLCVVILCLFSLLSTAIAGGTLDQLMRKTAGTRAGAIPAPNYVPDEVLIRFDEQTPHRLMAAAHAEVGTVVVHEYDSVPNLKLVKLPKGMTVQAALEYYKQLPGVHYVNPNSIHEVLMIPNDPWFGELWGLQNTGQRGGRPGADIHAPEAWDITTGDHEVVVAVLDTGIDYQHPDLAANMFRNEAECIPNGIDDDDNGVVDDCYGFNALEANSPPMDDEGHGTHVAGTIGAVGNNTLGVVGVNWNVRLLACKWLNYEGKGYDSDAIKCLDYVARLKQRGVNIVATSNSWGGGAYNQGLRDAIDRQRQLGILFVAAAGNSASNSDNDATPHYPSSYDVPNIIAVAATTRTDGLAWFSNVGRRTVHLGAPGTDILSTYLPESSPVRTSYQWLSGTSMATPHVSGVAALLKARHPAWDWKAIKNTIVASGDPLPALANTISGRRLNAERALTCANAPALSRLTPISTSLVGSTGDPIQLSVLHINCDQPNGEVTVRVDPPGEQVVLHDDGQKPDQEPRDGIYTGQWTPTAAGTFTLTFPDGSVVIVTVPLQYHYEATTFRWRTIDGTTLNLGDNETSTISTPFSIRFAGARFPTLRVNSNGILWPGEGSLISWLSAIHEPLPTRQLSTASRPFIFPFWTDLYPIKGSVQNVFYAVMGAPPNRELVVQWSNVRHSDCSGDGAATVTFQVVLFEGVDDIEFHYRDVHFGGGCSFADGGGSATIGVQVTSQLATQFSYDSTLVQDQTSLLWTWK